MKRKIALLIMLCTACISIFSGCTTEKIEDKQNGIYYIKDKELNQVAFEDMSDKHSKIADESGDEQVDDLIELISSGDEIPSDGESILQDGITIESYQLDNNILYINLTGDYGSVSSTDKLFLVAGVVKTMCQTESVDFASFTIDNEPLYDLQGNEYGLLTEDNFVLHSKSDINNFINSEMILYYSDDTGNELKSETRTVYYNRNKQIELAVIEELIKGTQSTSLKSILPSNLKIASVTVKNDICYVNFTVDSIDTFTGANMKLGLYSIVDSLYSVCGAKKVQFQVNGDSDIKIGNMDLDTTYKPNI